MLTSSSESSMFIFKAFYIHRWLSAIEALDIDELSRLCISANSHLIYVERAYIDNPLLGTRTRQETVLLLGIRYSVKIDPGTSITGGRESMIAQVHLHLQQSAHGDRCSQVIAVVAQTWGDESQCSNRACTWEQLWEVGTRCWVSPISLYHHLYHCHTFIPCKE